MYELHLLTSGPGRGGKEEVLKCRALAAALGRSRIQEDQNDEACLRRLDEMTERVV